MAKLEFCEAQIREGEGEASMQFTATGTPQQLAEFRKALAENEDMKEENLAMRQEIASVLMLMDGLAEQWGDEGVFRRCRDRLRKLLEPNPPTR